MATATQNNATVGLSDDTIKKLRELRQLNVDSAKGFEECAESVEEATLKSAFREIAHTRREQAQSLATQIEWNDKCEPEEGSFLASVHRSWIKVRDSFASDNTLAALEEAERGEDQIKEAYEEALEQTTGSPIHSLITEQYAAVKTTHDKVRDLRDARKA